MERIKRAAANVLMFVIVAAVSGTILGCTPVEREPASQDP